jgi:hypothetical protein
MMAAMDKLNPLLQLKKYRRGALWHADPGNFTSGTKKKKKKKTERPSGDRSRLSGSLDISPAWFQQVHEVSCFNL